MHSACDVNTGSVFRVLRHNIALGTGISAVPVVVGKVHSEQL